MSTYTRLRTTRQRRHVDATSESHKADAAAAAQRREIVFVAVEAPAREPHEPWPLESSAEIFDGTTWTPTRGAEEFADYLDDQHKRRAFFIDLVKRKGHAERVPMRRKVQTPLENFTVNLSPWANHYFRHQLSLGHNPKAELTQIRNGLVDAAAARLKDKRFLLGCAFHTDSAELHWDLPTSRYEDGKRIGTVGNGLAGPWCVAVDRQLRCGAQISNRKSAQLSRDVANFHRRYGEQAVPLDVAFARDVDAVTDAVIGAKLEVFKSAYRGAVPDIEARNDAEALAALDAARAKISPPQAATSTPELSA